MIIFIVFYHKSWEFYFKNLVKEKNTEVLCKIDLINHKNTSTKQ